LTASTTGTVQFEDGSGCLSQIYPITITVNPVPAPTIEPVAAACPGSQLTLRTNTSASSYVWTKDGTLVGNGPELPLTSLSAADAGTYQLEVSSSGCTGTATVDVTLSDQQAAGVTIPNTSCNNVDSIPLNATVTDLTGLSFAWTTTGNGTIRNPNSLNTSYVPTTTDNGQVDFTLTTTGSGCPIAPITNSVTFSDAPNLTASISDLNPAATTAVTFDVTGDAGLTYNWLFQDQPPATGESVTLTYEIPGQYRAIVTASNATGCSTSDTIIFNVRNSTSLFIPNVFSPNATNADNSSLKVFGTEVSESGFNFRVFNRWGELVFETNNFGFANSVGWDGNFNGDPQPMGAYTYTLTGTFNNGRTIELVGTVTLIR
jgi:gliding motility-associated-like protein